MSVPEMNYDWSRPDNYIFQAYRHLRTLGSRPRGQLPELDQLLKRIDHDTEYKVVKKHGVYQGIKQVFFPGEYLIHEELLRNTGRCHQIVRMSDFWLTESGIRANLEFEFCEGGDVQSLVDKAREAEKPVPVSLVLHVLTHVLLAIVFLETGSTFDFESKKFSPDDKDWIPIVHREICLKNIYFRYTDLSGDEIPLPEPVLGNFRHAIPAASHYDVVAWRYQQIKRIVDGRKQPVFVEYSTFNKRLYINPEILPPDSAQSVPEVDERGRLGATNTTPAQRFSTNLYQVGAAIASLATGAPWMADDKNHPLAHDREYLKYRLQLAGLSKVMTGILVKLTEPNPDKRGDARTIKTLVSTIIKTRDAHFAKESVDGRYTTNFYMIRGMPAGGKRSNIVVPVRDERDSRSRRPRSSSGSGTRSSSPIRDAFTSVKNYVRSHSPVRRSSFSRSDSYRQDSSFPFGGDQRPGPRTLY